jgi:hypothetical protein
MTRSYTAPPDRVKGFVRTRKGAARKLSPGLPPADPDRRFLLEVWEQTRNCCRVGGPEYRRSVLQTIATVSPRPIDAMTSGRGGRPGGLRHAPRAHV